MRMKYVLDIIHQDRHDIIKGTNITSMSGKIDNS